MVTKTKPVTAIPTGPIDCACVIHGQAYPWTYVEHLYNMLQRNISPGIRLHVYTEAERPVPGHMIKHTLTDWGISGPKLSWWYKLQMFNAKHHAGPLLYFDLDTVITANIDWIWNLSLRYFWAVQDFKYLWRPAHQGINSSVMWWDTREYDHLWRTFQPNNIQNIVKAHPGDQDYLNKSLDPRNIRFFPQEKVQSWRWQCLDGGYNFRQRMYQNPGSGTVIQKNTSVLIFHGNPKPADIADPVIAQYWQ